MFNKSSIVGNSHDYVEERLSAFIDGQLSEEERANVRKHLQSCRRCQTSLDTLGWTVKLLKQVPAPALPRQFTLPVPDVEPAPARVPWLRWGLAAASGVAALAIVFLVTIELLSPPRGGAPGLAQSQPAGARVQPTLVAAAAPTRAPITNDRGAPPAFAPAPTGAPVGATSLAPAPSQVQATAAPQATQAPSFRESIAPTETEARVTTKLTAPSPSCEGCGGGVGGGPSAETPQPMTITAASAVSTTGTVKDGPLSVRSAPYDKAPRLGLLARGTDLQILDRDAKGDWLKIVYPTGNDQGTTAWVMAKFVSVQVPIDSIPTAEPPTATPTPPGEMMLDAPEGIQTPWILSRQGAPEIMTTQFTVSKAPYETLPPTPSDVLAVAEPFPLRPTAQDVPASAFLTPLSVTSLPQFTSISPVRLGEIAAFLVLAILAVALWLTR